MILLLTKKEKPNESEKNKKDSADADASKDPKKEEKNTDINNNQVNRSRNNVHVTSTPNSGDKDICKEKLTKKVMFEKSEDDISEVMNKLDDVINVAIVDLQHNESDLTLIVSDNDDDDHIPLSQMPKRDLYDSQASNCDNKENVEVVEGSKEAESGEVSDGTQEGEDLEEQGNSDGTQNGGEGELEDESDGTQVADSGEFPVNSQDSQDKNR